MDSVAGCDKDRTDALIDRSTVHIDGSTEWKYEGCDLTFGTKFLSTFQVDRQVPTEEALENANMIAGSMPLKNFSGSFHRVFRQSVNKQLQHVQHSRYKLREVP